MTDWPCITFNTCPHGIYRWLQHMSIWMHALCTCTGLMLMEFTLVYPHRTCSEYGVDIYISIVLTPAFPYNPCWKHPSIWSLSHPPKCMQCHECSFHALALELDGSLSPHIAQGTGCGWNTYPAPQFEEFACPFIACNSLSVAAPGDRPPSNSYYQISPSY